MEQTIFAIEHSQVSKDFSDNKRMMAVFYHQNVPYKQLFSVKYKANSAVEEYL